MSLRISRISRLIRLNAASQVEKRACLCSSATLQQGNETDVSDGSKTDKAIKLVGTPEVPKYIEKKVMISRAMQVYIQNKQKEDEIKQKHVSEIKLGERHLANIMGVDVNDLLPGDVKRALQYILPSGLHSREARPSMELPRDMVIEPADIKMAASGRPRHYLYYTLKPSYFQLMHEMAMLLEEIRDEQAVLLNKRKSLKPSTPEETNKKETFNRVVNQSSISFSALKKDFTEPVSEADEKKFYTLLERIISQPLAYKRKEFFDRFPRPESYTSKQSIKRELQVNADGNQVAYAEGGRKTMKARVKVTDKGSGNLKINDEDILFFEDIIHREAVLFPLKFLGLLGKYDIEATVTSSTIPGQNCQSAQAGAVRLAIARAVANFVTDEDVFRLEKAGLLTRDPRMRERKKPGKKGARKKYTWKAR